MVHELSSGNCWTDGWTHTQKKNFYIGGGGGGGGHNEYSFIVCAGVVTRFPNITLMDCSEEIISASSVLALLAAGSPLPESPTSPTNHKDNCT